MLELFPPQGLFSDISTRLFLLSVSIYYELVHKTYIIPSGICYSVKKIKERGRKGGEEGGRRMSYNNTAVRVLKVNLIFQCLLKKESNFPNVFLSALLYCFFAFYYYYYSRIYRIS
uniref:Uncharacterized protein n=1 Tax=Cacopsylla melanoneura TaxID=428564 RepID=A0A8D9FK08_9HEMI